MKWQAAAVVLISNILASPVLADVCSADKAIFLGGGRSIEVAVEIADDPQERAQGLMFRTELAEGSGMLFIYEHPQPVSFWMRNTLIPLDMVFITATGEVRHVHPMARPRDETPIPGAAIGDPDPNRLMVLEVAGGEAAHMGIVPGMVLRHPGLPRDQARIPCN